MHAAVCTNVLDVWYSCVCS